MAVGGELERGDGVLVAGDCLFDALLGDVQDLELVVDAADEGFLAVLGYRAGCEGVLGLACPYFVLGSLVPYAGGVVV